LNNIITLGYGQTNGDIIIRNFTIQNKILKFSKKEICKFEFNVNIKKIKFRIKVIEDD